MSSWPKKHVKMCIQCNLKTILNWRGKQNWTEFHDDAFICFANDPIWIIVRRFAASIEQNHPVNGRDADCIVINFSKKWPGFVCQVHAAGRGGWVCGSEPLLYEPGAPVLFFLVFLQQAGRWAICRHLHHDTTVSHLSIYHSLQHHNSLVLS